MAAADALAAVWSWGRRDNTAGQSTTDVTEDQKPAAHDEVPAHKNATEGSGRLINDILREIGKAQEAGNQHKPILTWELLQEITPELTNYLVHAAHRQAARDAQVARETSRRQRGAGPRRSVAADAVQKLWEKGASLLRRSLSGDALNERLRSATEPLAGSGDISPSRASPDMKRRTRVMVLNDIVEDDGTPVAPRVISIKSM